MYRAFCISLIPFLIGLSEGPPVYSDMLNTRGSEICLSVESQLRSNLTSEFCIDTTKEITVTTFDPGGLALPVYMDHYFENGNYYALVVNNTPGGVVRLNFGNSLLNTPTMTELGNFGGSICNSAQGIKIVKASNNVIALITGGDPGPGYASRIVKLDFGESITNTPKATNWGNPGRQLKYPHDIYVFQESDGWYGLTVNYIGGDIIRLFFGEDFSKKPVAENLGSEKTSGPTSIFPIVHEGRSFLFVTNYNNQTVTRVDFGNSFRNTPRQSFSFKDPNGGYSRPRDIHIFNSCSNPVGYVINGGSDDLVQVSFSKELLPTNVTIITGIDGLSAPQSFSPVFKEKDTPYLFAPNVTSNTVTRIKFPATRKSTN